MCLDLFEHLKGKADKIIGSCDIPIDEFPAIISHYLQSEGTIRIYGDQSFWKRCNREISSFGNLTVFNKQSVQKYLAKSSFNGIPFPPPTEPEFTFIDLFAGIGGFRIAFQELAGKCVFSCEWDKFAKETYFKNFGEYPFGDVNQFTDPKIVSDETLKRLIPDHDVLAAGFPCQPFSIAGVSKKRSLGRKHGFEDPTQGTLFFDIKRILKEKRPAAFFLENVKNLLSHDGTRTFKEIKRSLRKDLGYIINFGLVDGKYWVPQHRERVYIVGYDPDKIKVSKDEILIPKEPENGHRYKQLKDIIGSRVDEKYTLGPGTWKTLKRHKEYHKKAGNGFGYGLNKWPIKKGAVTRTISARYHKDGAEILIEQKGKRPRRLTPREAMQLQGFDPDRFFFPVSDTQAYRQIGNSVVIPAIQATANEIVNILTN
jgi:DNA (cytosine-5)-methyltransferase 1